MSTLSIDRELDVPAPHKTHSRRWIAAFAGLVVIGGAAYITSRPSPKPVVASVQSVEKEFQISMSDSTAPAGRIKVVVDNGGAVTHEFVAFRTDLPASALPMGTDNRINEDGAGITHIDPEAEDVAPGHAKTIVLDLTPGRYVFVCNLPGHYGSGMYTTMTVR